MTKWRAGCQKISSRENHAKTPRRPHAFTNKGAKNTSAWLDKKKCCTKFAHACIKKYSTSAR